MSTSKHPPTLTDPTGREHLLAEDVTTIGRAVENDVVVTSKRVSREHVHLRREGWRVILEDQNSTNGTFLNQERVLSPRELRDGDQIKVGDVILTFHDPNITFRESPLPHLEVDAAAGIVRIERQRVDLSAKEFTLLAYLYKNRGQICPKDEIAEAVWPEYEETSAFDYQVENLVRRLRSKIEFDPSDPQLLVTMRGLGYKLLAA
ncbi:MAG: Sensory transduction protein regX3 [Chloroflexi bacterium]|nr:Sensory transduction protein regX3 [Chloroflexota bacterium]